MHRTRRRALASRWGWLTSAVLHVAVLLLLAALLQPIDLGEVGPLVIEAALVSEDLPAETLSGLIDDLAVDTVPFEFEHEASSLDEGAPEIPVPFSPAARGRGRRGTYNAASGAQRGLGGGAGPRAGFFGTVAYGDRFVYLLDMSTSMDSSMDSSEGSRFQRALAEMANSIEQLDDRQSFYVILFCFQTRRMFDDVSAVAQMLPATRENKQRLRDWLAQVSTGSGTDPRPALRLGLELEPSAVFLLSDGQFNGQQTKFNDGLLHGNPDETEVVERHRRGETPIHTFAFEDPQNCKVMESLAGRTGGQYCFVPAPGDARHVVTVNQPRVRVSNPTTSANRSKYLLDRAKKLEAEGRTRQAAIRYQAIAKQFPNTTAGQEAAKRQPTLNSR